jgi:CRP-like cAMP-binding protein
MGETGSLDRIGLLGALTPEAREQLARRCAWRRYPAGATILARDQAGSEVLLIVEGAVRVVNVSPAGREVAYAIVEAGGHVGELAAIDGAPRSAGVVAVRGCLVASLSRPAFMALLTEEPAVAILLLRHLARIIRLADERIAELSTMGAVERVYSELLRLARPDPEGAGVVVVAPLPTQEDLAARVGTTRETVARALGRLARSGIARRRGRALSIRDPAILEALVTGE